MDKHGLCQRALCAVKSIVDATCVKTLKFKNHATIKDSHHKLITIYNPMKHFAEHFLSGYEISRSHETTPFSMNYREYWQRGLYLLLNDIYWIGQNIKIKFVFDCIEYKKLDLLAKIATKASKILQKWAIDYDLYVWHSLYWTCVLKWNETSIKHSHLKFYFVSFLLKTYSENCISVNSQCYSQSNMTKINVMLYNQL